MNDDIESPCVNICVLDAHRRLCRGCARTLEEIANWTTYTRAEKLAVLQRVAERKLTAGATLENR